MGAACGPCPDCVAPLRQKGATMGKPYLYETCISVLDFGAVGDGTNDDSTAFEAADRASGRRTIVVPPGVYRIDRDLTIDAPILFHGTIVQSPRHAFVLRHAFGLLTYIAAFGDDEEAFRKAFQALLVDADLDCLDMGGRGVLCHGPIDMAGAAGRAFSRPRCTIRNGTFRIAPAMHWDSEKLVLRARYDPSLHETRLSGVERVSDIPVGSRVTGSGVGCEVFVRAKDIAAETVDLSQPLFGAGGVQSYTFERHRYVLDFSGFRTFGALCLDNVALSLDGRASGILLPPGGGPCRIDECLFDSPRDRAITSPGAAFNGLRIDSSTFLADHRQTLAARRKSVAVNINGPGGVVRDTRFQGFGAALVLGGENHRIEGSRFCAGAGTGRTPRGTGVVFTSAAPRSVIEGNDFRDCAIEMTNQHTAFPDADGGQSLGDVTVTGNVFSATDTADFNAWIILKPFGSGQSIRGLRVTGNTFCSLAGQVERIERVDESLASLDVSRFDAVEFANNTFRNIRHGATNPATLTFDQPAPSAIWPLDPSARLPFGGQVRTVTSIVAVGALRDAAGRRLTESPSVGDTDDPNMHRATLRWSRAVRGRIRVTLRCDASG